MQWILLTWLKIVPLKFKYMSHVCRLMKVQYMQITLAIVLLFLKITIIVYIKNNRNDKNKKIWTMIISSHTCML